MEEIQEDEGSLLHVFETCALSTEFDSKEGMMEMRMIIYYEMKCIAFNI